MNKTIILQIEKPLDIDWRLFVSILYTIQSQTRTILNRTIQLCQEYQGFSSDYKKEFNLYPKDKDILGYTLSGFINSKVRNNNIIYSSNVSQSQSRALSRWNADLNDIIKGTKSVPQFKRDCPIDLHNKAITFFLNENNEYICKLNLLNKAGKKEYNRKTSEVRVSVNAGDNSTKSILNRIVSGEYKIGGSQIVKHKSKNKWFLNLSYSFTPKEKCLDEANVLGIDMGVKVPVYMAINGSWKREIIHGGEIESFRAKIKTMKKSIQKQTKYCGDGKIGHGVKTRMKAVERLSGKIKNFKDTCNHKYSRFVINYAIKNNCGTIQMEDLSGMAAGKKKATFLGDWTYYDLQQKIEYKAQEVGIKVIKIKPNYTSARCNKCGWVHRSKDKDKWRPKQEQFKCMNCDHGHKKFVHADYNAAQNIAMPNIEYIIESQLKKQEDDLKNTLKYADL